MSRHVIDQARGFVKLTGGNQLAINAVQTTEIATLGSAMKRLESLSPCTTFLCGLLAVAIGLFLLLIGLGAAPVNPGSVHGPLWIISAAGIAFMLAGISIAVGAIHGVSETGDLPKDTSWWMRLFYTVIGVIIAGALASIGSWVAFGPGPRTFSGTGMFLLSPEAGEVGRILFGFGAVLTWLCTIAIAVSGARKLFSGKST
jgi:hypothetical protein